MAVLIKPIVFHSTFFISKNILQLLSLLFPWFLPIYPQFLLIVYLSLRINLYCLSVCILKFNLSIRNPETIFEINIRWGVRYWKTGYFTNRNRMKTSEGLRCFPRYGVVSSSGCPMVMQQLKVSLNNGSSDELRHLSRIHSSIIHYRQNNHCPNHERL